ncbi:hypothetical protein P280DRAFT_550431 [Massarina eburnea CBS 473.64]|uniref:Zn(2)-C6 fungal-type domain-containing protein n=1 Tax=Massarina eburnea CBS 473.64 TaxID=1395130 RepID=A0A6A6RWL4_9PLEO|nr:hypothetical protein P280DRAFT_550431 [Massarina eburnea CBS 473.64]
MLHAVSAQTQPALVDMSRATAYQAQPLQLQLQLQTASPALHQYACLRCRSRRVKCDKMLIGCQNCASHGQQCVYSARRPRKPQKHAQEGATQRTLLPANASPLNHPSVGRADSLGTDLLSDRASSRVSGQSDDDDEDEEAIMPHELRDATYEVKNADGGRLLIGPDGDSRFINSERVKQLAYFETVLLTDAHVREDAKPKPPTNRNLDANSLLTTTHEKRDMRLYHPPAEIMHVLWDFFSRNVEIMAKVLYKPAVDALVSRAAKDLSSTTTEESLLFAIWLATALTMSPEECLQLHREEQPILIRRYRYALEQTLAQAGWMTTQNILVLQSLTLYLVFSSENARSTWILSGIALSVAQAMGMHSDSASFNLSPIEVEVRRRVWWMLCQLDVRISENCGLQSHVPLVTDTKLPLHINDLDLATANEVAPKPRDEFTDMTLSLIKIEMANTNLKLKRSCSTVEERKTVVRQQLERYDNIWLKYFDQESELHRLCALGTRLIMSRLWKLEHDLASTPTTEDGDTWESLIYYNANVLDISHQLPCKYRRHGWFFRCKYSQWHAVAYLLLQMCRHTQGPAVDRAWSSIDSAFADWEEGGITTSDTVKPGQKAIRSLWKPLLRLRARARAARREARHSPQASGSFDANTPSTLSTGYEGSNMTLEDVQNPVQFPDAAAQDVLIGGDPFFGNADDFSVEMNWERLDEWVQNFQDGLQQQDDYQEKDMMGALEWW